MRFIDSNVFAYHLAGDPRYGRRATAILQSVENGEETITSSLIIAQVCGYLKWKKKEKVIPIFLNLVKGLTSLRKVETQFIDFLVAADLQKDLQLPWKAWDDLVISAQMERLGVNEIYSRDADFDSIPQINRVF